MRAVILVPCLGIILTMATGCLSTQSSMTLVPDGSPGVPKPKGAPVALASFKPATTEIAARVDMVGRKIIADNPQMGVRPLFRTIGAPHPEIFHHGATEIDITEGLVKQCATEGQLAAVLCTELGKMVSEREALANPKTRQPERLPPMSVPVGNDGLGAGGPADGVRLAELGKFEKENRRPATVNPALPPDPQVLARTFLTNAKYPASDLEAAAPILKQAAANNALEKQTHLPLAP